MHNIVNPSVSVAGLLMRGSADSARRLILSFFSRELSDALQIVIRVEVELQQQ